jgi:DNA-binding transcriptional LysR family regulator
VSPLSERSISTDWSDLQFFLAVAREGSVRKAAGRLGVNHATVSRRIAAFEQRLGVHLFERLRSGYALTREGEEVLGSASRMQEEMDALERRVVGKDARLAGPIRFTLPDHMAEFLMPDLVAFTDRYPEIELEVAVSYSAFNLSEREADVALRGAQASPPEGLVGRRVAKHASCCFASPEYLARHDLAADPPTARWLGWDDLVPFPRWVKESDHPHIPVRGRFNHPQLQVAAARCGAGIAKLPCFLGDAEPGLVRVPPATLDFRWTLWLLTHRDLRTTARIRAFLDFLFGVLQRERPLLEGRRPRP